MRAFPRELHVVQAVEQIKKLAAPPARAEADRMESESRSCIPERPIEAATDTALRISESRTRVRGRAARDESLASNFRSAAIASSASRSAEPGRRERRHRLEFPGSEIAT